MFYYYSYNNDYYYHHYYTVYLISHPLITKLKQIPYFNKFKYQIRSNIKIIEITFHFTILSFYFFLIHLTYFL